MAQLILINGTKIDLPDVGQVFRAPQGSGADVVWRRVGNTVQQMPASQYPGADSLPVRHPVDEGLHELQKAGLTYSMVSPDVFSRPVPQTPGEVIQQSITQGNPNSATYISNLFGVVSPGNPLMAGITPSGQTGAGGYPINTAPGTQATPQTTPTSQKKSNYQIKQGDTLSKIAKQYGTSVQALMQANPQIKDANKIQAGASLSIPGVSSDTALGVNPPGASPGSGAGGTATSGLSGGATDTSTAGGNLQGSPQDPSLDSLKQALSQYFSQDAIQSMTPQEIRQFGIFSEFTNNQISQNKVIEQATRQTFQDALKTAQDDPNIKSKYGDAAAIALSDFQTTLTNIANEATHINETMPYDIRIQKENLEKEYASKGAAISGYRAAAEQRLEAEQSGIVTSTRSKLQQELNTLGKSYESVYGKTPPMTDPNTGKPISYTNPLTGASENLSYAPLGLTGTEKASKESDILARQQQIAQERIGQ